MRALGQCVSRARQSRDLPIPYCAMFCSLSGLLNYALETWSKHVTRNFAAGKFTVPTVQCTCRKLPGLEYTDVTAVVFGNLSGPDLAGEPDFCAKALQILFALETMGLGVWGLGWSTVRGG